MEFLTIDNRLTKTALLATMLFAAVAGMRPDVAAASIEEALHAARNRDFDQAFRLFRHAAESDDPEAQYRLAGMYKAGQGTKKNDRQAIEWYRKAADQGHAKAIKRLAALLKDPRPAPAGNARPEVQLLAAAQKGDLKRVVALIRAGVNVDYQDQYGISPVMEATRRGHIEILDELLAHKANPSLRNKDGDTALLIAVACGDPAALDKLLRHGAEVNVRNRQRSTPLMLAVAAENLALTERLLDHGADILIANKEGRTAYDMAHGRKNKKLMRLIEAAGGTRLARAVRQKEISQSLALLKSQSAMIKERGWTPVMYGAWRGDKNAVQAALTLKPDLAFRDGDGMTALSLAAQGGHLDILYMLLDAGANLNCAEKDEHHAFYGAAKQGHEKIVASMLPALRESPACRAMLEKALAHAVLNGRTALAELMLAQGINFTEQAALSSLIPLAAKADGRLIDLLMASGLDVNAANAAGETALMMAARHGNINGVMRLLKYKAAVNRQDSMGRTALIHAAQNGQTLCVKYLTNAAADVLWTTNEGNTALMLAAEKGYVSIVSLLSQYKNLDHKNNIGDTALIMAARGGHFDVSKILLEQGANPRLRNQKREKALSAAAQDNKKLVALLDEYESSRSWLQDIF